MKPILATASLTVLVLLGAGCAQNPPAAASAEVPFGTRNADVYTYEYGSAPAAQAGSGGYSTSAGAGGYAASDLGAPIGAPGSGFGALPSEGQVIYFEFDSAEIRADARPLIRSHAEAVAASTGVMVLLEGHADERGTREYNIGLGEQRGDAVRRLMIASGVSPEQIQVVSYGEERPAALGPDERSMALNRRVEIVY